MGGSSISTLRCCRSTRVSTRTRAPSPTARSGMDAPSIGSAKAWTRDRSSRRRRSTFETTTRRIRSPRACWSSSIGSIPPPCSTSFGDTRGRPRGPRRRRRDRRAACAVARGAVALRRGSGRCRCSRNVSPGNRQGSGPPDAAPRLVAVRARSAKTGRKRRMWTGGRGNGGAKNIFGGTLPKIHESREALARTRRLARGPSRSPAPVTAPRDRATFPLGGEWEGTVPADQRRRAGHVRPLGSFLGLAPDMRGGGVDRPRNGAHERGERAASRRPGHAPGPSENAPASLRSRATTNRRRSDP